MFISYQLPVFNQHSYKCWNDVDKDILIRPV